MVTRKSKGVDRRFAYEEFSRAMLERVASRLTLRITFMVLIITGLLANLSFEQRQVLSIIGGIQFLVWVFENAFLAKRERDLREFAGGYEDVEDSYIRFRYQTLFGRRLYEMFLMIEPAVWIALLIGTLLLRHKTG
jgi:hypothetical protein